MKPDLGGVAKFGWKFWPRWKNFQDPPKNVKFWIFRWHFAEIKNRGDNMFLQATPISYKHIWLVPSGVSFWYEVLNLRLQELGALLNSLNYSSFVFLCSFMKGWCIRSSSEYELWCYLDALLSEERSDCVSDLNYVLSSISKHGFFEKISKHGWAWKWPVPTAWFCEARKPRHKPRCSGGPRIWGLGI